ncbi:MAG: TPM domain-containing protein [Ignavibacteriales bacterium]|nr:TPM domain-containing protein [Ignavibacteriales bacterium]
MFYKKYLSKIELASLANVITEAESKTSGEIRVVMRQRRGWKDRKLSIHELAVKEFQQLGMQNTRDKTGVLILLLLSDRKFQIIADSGINSKVQAGRWNEIAVSMSGYFKEKKYFDGISESIKAVGEELSKYFPRKADDTNELSNEIIQQ